MAEVPALPPVPAPGAAPPFAPPVPTELPLAPPPFAPPAPAALLPLGGVATGSPPQAASTSVARAKERDSSRFVVR
ncbi:hypothetical protein WMF38_49500 [Sorangium sp. So ce118]